MSLENKEERSFFQKLFGLNPKINKTKKLEEEKEKMGKLKIEDGKIVPVDDNETLQTPTPGEAPRPSLPSQEQQSPPLPPVPLPPQAPIQQAPIQQAPIQQAPIQQAPIQQAPIQQAPTQQAPTQQAPTQQAPTQFQQNIMDNYEEQRLKIQQEQSMIKPQQEPNYKVTINLTDANSIDVDVPTSILNKFIQDLLKAMEEQTGFILNDRHGINGRYIVDYTIE